VNRYIAQRLFLMVPTAIVVTVIGFALLRLSPGDPVLIYAGEERDAESLAEIRSMLELDQPLPAQYVGWIRRVVVGDLGRSIRTSQPVRQAILERLPATLQLGITALILSVGGGLLLGTITAVRRNSVTDMIATVLTLGIVSVPNFVLGMVLILTFALVWRIFPPGGYTSFIDEPSSNLRRLVLPALTLAATSLAINLRHVRSGVLDVLSQDYIRTAYAKGLTNRAVLFSHALRNALIPALTIAGIQVSTIIEGAIVTETLFSWPGIGRLIIESISGRDYPVVQGIMLLSALSVMLSSLFIDILYVWFDPRIAHHSRGI
jgi:peptide/nickel transport system permease protein